MERIASRRARWHTIHRPQRDAPCTRCDGVYAGHDLVLSPVGVVCESCETAIQIDFEAKLSSREAVAATGLGLAVLLGLPGLWLAQWIALDDLVWGISLSGVLTVAVALRHLQVARDIRMAAVEAEVPGPPWWGRASALVRGLAGLGGILSALVMI